MHPNFLERSNRSNRSNKAIRMTSVRADVLFLAGGRYEYAYFAAVWVDYKYQSTMNGTLREHFYLITDML